MNSIIEKKPNEINCGVKVVEVPCDYIQPQKNWKCKLGFHAWCPIHNSKGSSICMRCNLEKDCYGCKRIARVKKDGSVL